MATPWISNVTRVSDGEAVNQAVTNRALLQLAQRTQYLKETLDSRAPSTGKILYSGANIAEGVTSGSWVYRDEISGTHDKALFILESDPSSMASPSPSSAVVGVVVSAANTNDATILVAGASVSPSDLGVSSWQDMCVTGETFSPGLQFLSDKESGKMTRSAGASSVQLGWFGYDWARILPVYGDPLVQHRHDSFVLRNRPASYSRIPSILSPIGFTPDFSYDGWTSWYTNYWSTGSRSLSIVPERVHTE